MKQRTRCLFALVLAPLYVAGAGTFLVAWGSRDRAQKADAIVVFGARVAPNGAASPILRARTRHAFALWEKKLAPVIVCTGGVGTYPPAEAVVQKRLLLGWGVPASAVLVDDASTSTRENARNAAQLLPRGARVIAVSEAFHLWRCRRDCARFGLRATTSPETAGGRALSVWGRAFYAAREAVLVTRDFFL